MLFVTIFIFYSDGFYASGFENSGSDFIILPCFISVVNRSVYFQSHIQFGTIKISDKAIYYLLSSPFEVFDFSVPQQLPHCFFTLRGNLTKTLSKFQLFWVYPLTTYYAIIRIISILIIILGKYLSFISLGITLHNLLSIILFVIWVSFFTLFGCHFLSFHPPSSRQISVENPPGSTLPLSTVERGLGGEVIY